MSVYGSDWKHLIQLESTHDDLIDKTKLWDKWEATLKKNDFSCLQKTLALETVQEGRSYMLYLQKVSSWEAETQSDGMIRKMLLRRLFVKDYNRG